MLKKHDNGSYTIENNYGVFNFPNRQKLLKFRLQCRHPMKVEFTDFLETKILCGRCGTLFGKIPNSGPKVCHLAKRALAGRTPDDQKQLDDWMNEGGICY
jgi:hypothetical protein